VHLFFPCRDRAPFNLPSPFWLASPCYPPRRNFFPRREARWKQSFPHVLSPSSLFPVFRQDFRFPDAIGFPAVSLLLLQLTVRSLFRPFSPVPCVRCRRLHQSTSFDQIFPSFSSPPLLLSLILFPRCELGFPFLAAVTCKFLRTGLPLLYLLIFWFCPCLPPPPRAYRLTQTKSGA